MSWLGGPVLSSLLLAAFLAPACRAAESPKFLMHMYLGGDKFDLGSLDAALAASGKTMSDWSLSAGAEALLAAGRKRRHYFGLGGFLTSKSADFISFTGATGISLDVKSLMAVYQYDLARDRVLRLGTVAGIGPAWQSLSKFGGSLPFGSVAGSAAAPSEVERTSVLLDLGFNADVWLIRDGPWLSTPAIASYIFGINPLNIRLGYKLPISEGAWQSGGIDATGIPDISLAGPYIRAQIGLGF